MTQATNDSRRQPEPDARPRLAFSAPRILGHSGRDESRRGAHYSVLALVQPTPVDDCGRLELHEGTLGPKDGGLTRRVLRRVTKGTVERPLVRR